MCICWFALCSMYKFLVEHSEENLLQVSAVYSFHFLSLFYFIYVYVYTCIWLYMPPLAPQHSLHHKFISIINWITLPPSG